MAAWSFSALTGFETCPKKYYHEKVARTVKEKKSAVTDYGSEAHKKFELRLIKNKPLPLDLRHHEKVLARLAAAPGEGMPEQKLAITKDLEPTGFFDRDVWCRAVIDYAKVNETRLLIVDHKFGKLRPGFDQVDLMFAVMRCYMPEIESATGAYYWAKEKKFTSKKYKASDDMDIWGSYIPRVERLDQAIKDKDFPPRPSGLCKRYCGVTSCPYNGT